MKINDAIICNCSSDEHQLIFKYNNEDEDWDEVFISVHLYNHSFWYKVKYAFKYIFGYKCRYGAWDEIIIPSDEETIRKFEDVVKYLKKVEKRRKDFEIQRDQISKKG